MGGEEIEPDMEGEEMTPETPAVPEPEMAEGFDFDDDEDDEDYGLGIPSDMPSYKTKWSEDDDDDFAFKHRGARKRRIHHEEISDDESFQVEDMIESLFSESKVDSVLNKYFGDEPTKKVIKENINKKETTFTKAQKLSESKSQEAATAQLIKKYPTAKLVGKTPKKDLVFEVEDKKLKVSTKGGYKLL